jgi:antitoxin HicB
VIDMRYAVTLAPDDNNTILVTVPDIPEAVTFGEDREDALARAIDAIETAFMGRIADREDIPAPITEGSDHIDLPAPLATKVELYRAMRAERRSGTGSVRRGEGCGGFRWGL